MLILLNVLLNLLGKCTCKPLNRFIGLFSVFKILCFCLLFFKKNRFFVFKLLSANLTKWSNTLKQFLDKQPANCLSLFDLFIGLALKARVLYFLTNFYFSLNDNPSNNQKYVFYFIFSFSRHSYSL